MQPDEDRCLSGLPMSGHHLHHIRRIHLDAGHSQSFTFEGSTGVRQSPLSLSLKWLTRYVCDSVNSLWITGKGELFWERSLAVSTKSENILRLMNSVDLLTFCNQHTMPSASLGFISTNFSCPPVSHTHTISLRFKTECLTWNLKLQMLLSPNVSDRRLSAGYLGAEFLFTHLH